MKQVSLSILIAVALDSITLGASHFSAKDNTASVFLLFYYGDKTTEQVVVPMVKEHGKWILR